MSEQSFNGVFTNENLTHVAFPLGGIGAGMICLTGWGAFSNVSLRHRPEAFTAPNVLAAISVKGHPGSARILQGQIPRAHIFGTPSAGGGSPALLCGLPRFRQATFTGRFPFATVELADGSVPLRCSLTAWSPFVATDPDSASLPVAVLEYSFVNETAAALESVFSYHVPQFSRHWPGQVTIRPVVGGFVEENDPEADKPEHRARLMVYTDTPEVSVDAAWFRGSWFDAKSITWRHIEQADVVANGLVTEGQPSPGGSLYVPFTLAPGESRTIRVNLLWYVPDSDYRIDPVGGSPQPAPAQKKSDCCDGGSCCPSARPAHYRPWYAGRFDSIGALRRYWDDASAGLRRRSALFRDCLWDTTLPPEVQDAVAANLSILKSPTALRQEDGRLWLFEGCGDQGGCCAGSCTHVWNYAQAVAHLFPSLERSLRQTEFVESQTANGWQSFRAMLPVAPVPVVADRHAAADGQLGGIIKVYRDWRISGDTAWLRDLWPRVRASLDYCIGVWDPDQVGALIEPHHNTYDIEFWGADGMCTSFYLGALVAATRMAEALGDDPTPYAELAAKARAYMQERLFDGEYYIQHIQWTGLRAPDPSEAKSLVGDRYSPEAIALLREEGPKYQYGAGCLADGILGAWMAEVAGLEPVLDLAQIRSHLLAVYTHNLKSDLIDHVNPQRPGYALGQDGGLLLCTWPKGGALSLPFVYSNEVWTGIEYQVAAHLIQHGCVDEGLAVVREARKRYAGDIRNPYNEYECGSWYGRALSSYALLYACTGARYDAVEQVLYLRPQVAGDFRAFFCTETGFGTVGMRGGEPFLEVRSGEIPVRRIALQSA